MASIDIAESTRARPAALAWFLAGASIGAAGIHFAVIGEHASEYVAFGVFFAVVAWFQALWAIAIVASPRRPVVMAGLIGNAAVVLVWVVSRTAGLPLGPEPRVAEPAAFADVLSTVLEIVIVIGAALFLRGPRARAARKGGLVLAIGWFLAIAVLSSIAIASAAGGQANANATGASAMRRAMEDSLPPSASVDMGGGRIVRTIVGTSDGLSHVDLTFLQDGGELPVRAVTLTAGSTSGRETTIPMTRFAAGHFAASTHLDPGDWSFRIVGTTSDGQPFDVTYEVAV